MMVRTSKGFGFLNLKIIDIDGQQIRLDVREIADY